MQIKKEAQAEPTETGDGGLFLSEFDMVSRRTANALMSAQGQQEAGSVIGHGAESTIVPSPSGKEEASMLRSDCQPHAD
jgi:hypothetical protein